MKSLSRTLRRFISQPSTYYHSPGDPIIKSVTLLPGAFIGPEITDAVRKVFQAAKVPVHFDIIEEFDFKKSDHKMALKKNKCLLMGNTGRKNSMTLEHTEFYRYLDLHARVVHAYNFPGINTRHKDVDIVVIRENLEGEFSGVEHEVVPGVFESIKICTKENSLRIATYAFEYAFLSGRKRVTAVHKANIMKLVDGLFLEATREVAQRFPSILYDEIIIDNCAMQLASKPQQFDVMVMPNLYGSIVSSICAGLVGGAGIVPGASIGIEHMLFDQACRNSGFDIAGRNVANPTALLLSSVNMLKSLHLTRFADLIHNALVNVYEEKKVLTQDVGGAAKTHEFTARLCDEIMKLD
jgi:isocitrate dehydrogenase (NAD+)